MYIDAFLLGGITHAGLLMGSTLQVAYLLSRGLAGMATTLMASVFFVSSLIASYIALFIVNTTIVNSNFNHTIIAVIAIGVLLFESYKAHKRSKQNHLCCNDSKIYSVVFSIALVWLNPHIYMDIISLYSISATFKNINVVSFYLGFNAIAFVWFYGVAIFANKAQVFFQNITYHKYMHRLSSIILLVAATALLLGTFILEHSH